MSSDGKLDEQIAAYTDCLLAGEKAEISQDMVDLAPVVRQIYDLIEPDRPPDPVFREQLTQRLNHEWMHLHTHRRARRPWYRSRTGQLMAAAASLTVILLAVALAAGGMGDGSSEGTALGSIAWVGVVIVLVGGMLAVWWQRRQ